MTNQTKDEAGLRELLAAGPALPWFYRPQEYDDWGFIRGGTPTEYGLPVVALGREGGLSQADHDGHRRNGTDPYGPSSELIVAAVNALPALLDEIETLRAQLTEALEARDQYANLYMDRVGQLNVANSELTAATRRAEQAESMLAEVVGLLREAHEGTFGPKVGGGDGQTFIARALPAELLNRILPFIRSAASGEQG